GGPLPQQPTLVALPLTRDPPTPHGHELLAQPAFGPPAPADDTPLPAGDSLEEFIGSPPSTGGGIPQLYGEVRPHPHDIGLLAGFQAGQKVGVVSIISICHDPAMGHPPGPRLIEERQGNFLLGLERNF